MEPNQIEQIEQDKADVAREEVEFAQAEKELQAAKDKLAADEIMAAEVAAASPATETDPVPFLANDPEPAPAVLEVPVATEPTDDEIAMASARANAGNVAVALATLEQQKPDTQVGILDEIDNLAGDMGGVNGEKLLLMSSRMRAVLAGVL